jgi:hypothetical protein
VFTTIFCGPVIDTDGEVLGMLCARLHARRQRCSSHLTCPTRSMLWLNPGYCECRMLKSFLQVLHK